MMRSCKAGIRSFVSPDMYPGLNKALGSVRSFSSIMAASDKRSANANSPMEEAAYYRATSGSGFGKYEYIVSDLVLASYI